jgi:integrase
MFGKKLITEIDGDDIARFQRNRKRSGAAASEINKECAVLRMILRKHRTWHLLAFDYHPLRESGEIGRALSIDEMSRLLKAARNSRSQSLYPAIVLLQNTGLRVSELRTLQWKQIDMFERSVTVGKSKTRGGEGRMVPLNREAFTALTEWRENFCDPAPEHYVFPSERYGLKGFEGMKRGMVAVWDRNLNKPIGSWKTSWGICRKAAKVDCRLHDLRHTFVSRLAEGQNPDQTIMALAGHVSRKMMERYSHVRNEAKRRAVEGLNAQMPWDESPQNPHSENETSHPIRRKSLI